MNRKKVWRSRRGSLRWVGEASVAVSLLLALLLVFGVDRLRPPPSPEPKTNGPIENGKGNDPPPVPQRPMRIGVTPSRPEFDDMGSLLETLGEGYKYQPFPLDDLNDLKKISEYTVIFVTCSGVPDSWVKERLGDAARPNTIKVIVDKEKMQQAADNLREFVGKGGSLYVSDLHFNLIALAFPRLVDHRKVDEGRVQEVKAEVIDPGLRELIGSELSLQFDQPGWRPAAFIGSDVVTYMKGSYQNNDGEQKTAPLLVKFPYKDGIVFFTSFHNEKVNHEVELKLLRYLVFSAVTAKVQSEVIKTLVQGGFSPAKRSIFSPAKKGETSVTQTYRCTKKGSLQFVLGFQGEGARLKFTVTGPDGQSFEEEDESTITIDVPNAIPGDWKYTVTAVELPYANFAYSVTVGEK